VRELAQKLAQKLVLGSLVLGSLYVGSTQLAAAPIQGKPDQVFYINPRGEVRTDNGLVESNTLTETVITNLDGDEKKRKSASVVRVVFGRVPAAYSDGLSYMQRGDFENAAAKFRLAAGDGETRPAVQAQARLEAARALVEQAKVDQTVFGEAKSELETFLADHATNREVPAARMLHGRTTLLSGDSVGALASYRGLFGEGESGTPTPGYSLALCYEAGIAAVDTALMLGNADAAREILSSIETSLPGVLAGLEEEDPNRMRLLAVQASARLGEGWVLLASEQTSQAVTFFRTQVQNAQADEAELRFGAQLGFGMALLASGKAREAQLELAKVSALDFSSRDRAAKALIGLANCALSLPDSNARSQAKAWVTTVLERYADTPAVLDARDLSKKL
jgi:hypothetical protein